MIWRLSAILGVAMLLSCSGEKPRGTTEEPRGIDHTNSAPIEFSPPSPDIIPDSRLGEQIRLGYQIVVIRKNMPDSMSAIVSTAPTVILMAGSIRMPPHSSVLQQSIPSTAPAARG